MTIRRINVWRKDPDGSTAMSDEAKRVIGVPCAVHTFTLHNDSDGSSLHLEVFGRGHVDAVAAIPPDAPAWAEGVVGKLFDSVGFIKPDPAGAAT